MPAFKFANLGANLGRTLGPPVGPFGSLCCTYVCISPYGVWVPLYRGMAYGSPFDLGPLLSQPRKNRQRASSPTDGSYGDAPRTLVAVLRGAAIIARVYFDS
jgi:hypothetical protein